ncbi:MAG: ester cyclase [Pseudomonadota bacterium]
MKMRMILGPLAIVAALIFSQAARASDMSEVKNLSRQAVEMWAGDAVIDTAIFAPGYMNHQEPKSAGGVGSVDLQTWVQIVEGTHSAFPDLTVEIYRQIAEGDMVATHWRFAGTQSGPYLGQAATNRSVAWTGVQIDKIEGGKIAESWVVWDFHSLLVELGLNARE